MANKRSESQYPLVAVAGTAAVAGGLTLLLTYLSSHRRERKNSAPLTAHEQLIVRGTPLVKLEHVSRIVGRNIYVKLESMNPGGTGKDRAALSMIRHAEDNGLLPPPYTSTAPTSLQHRLDDLQLCPSDGIVPTIDPQSSSEQKLVQKMEAIVLQALATSRTGGLVVEGTSGSTGIALATLCAARGHGCCVVLPDDQANEKQTILRSLGAVVYEVPTAAISNPYHYVNLARKAAALARDKFQSQAVFMDQFENTANFQIHYRQTGPELWKQLHGCIDSFVMSAGTGGTISGVGTYLKERNPNIRVVLVDPPGSSLYHKIEHGVVFAVEQRERSLRKHRYDTLAEGIGLDRLTHNFSLGLKAIDKAFQITDQEAVDMAHWILKVEGLWVGSSSAMNLVGAVRTALESPKDSNVVTMICDGGQRHATRFWNPEFIKEWGLQWPVSECVPDCLDSVLAGHATHSH